MFAFLFIFRLILCWVYTCVSLPKHGWFSLTARGWQGSRTTPTLPVLPCRLFCLFNIAPRPQETISVTPLLRENAMMQSNLGSQEVFYLILELSDSGSNSETFLSSPTSVSFLLSITLMFTATRSCCGQSIR